VVAQPSGFTLPRSVAPVAQTPVAAAVAADGGMAPPAAQLAAEAVPAPSDAAVAKPSSTSARMVLFTADSLQISQTVTWRR
jgi:hypothetical protein